MEVGFLWQSIVLNLKKEGLKKLPPKGPIIVAANHVSNWDPIIVGASLSRPVHFMAKKELFSYIILGPLIRKLGAFPVDRNRVDRASLRNALSLLDEGKIVCIFPEGTRGRTGTLLPPLPGAAFLARKAGVPVCPVALLKKRRFWGNIVFPRYYVKVGSTFSIEEAGKRDRQDSANFMMAKIQEIIDFLLQTSRNLYLPAEKAIRKG